MYIEIQIQNKVQSSSLVPGKARHTPVPNYPAPTLSYGPHTSTTLPLVSLPDKSPRPSHPSPNNILVLLLQPPKTRSLLPNSQHSFPSLEILVLLYLKFSITLEEPTILDLITPEPVLYNEN